MRVRFKDLTEEDKEYIRLIYFSERLHKDKTDTLCKKFNISERSVRGWWQKMNLTNIHSGFPPQLDKALSKNIDKNTEVLLITTAQNKTTVNIEFLNNLKAYKDFVEKKLNKKTEILIIPSRYRNPSSNIEDEKTRAMDWWEDKIDEYLIYGKVNFGDSLISADSRISPTAKEPLLGYELLADEGHVILGHSKIHFKTLPRLRGEDLRCLLTTGYITNKNYSKSKAGEIGFEHHSYGFVVVEKKNNEKCYIPRNVKVKSDGSFTDIIYSVDKCKVEIINNSLGFVWGDIHAYSINEKLLDITKELICNKLKPDKVVVHDVFDGGSINPHEDKDLYVKRRKIIEGKNLLDKELELTFSIMEKILTCSEQIHVVESNHDVFTDRYINNFNWKNDLYNSPTYLKIALIQQTEDLTKHGNLFGYLLNEKFGERIKYLVYGESLKIGGYECGQHGDVGVNGSKGQTRSFSRINTKMIHGHTHSPMIHNNVTSVGVTCNTEQFYNRKGFSNWGYAHSVVHNNGKNQLLVFDDSLQLSGLI